MARTRKAELAPNLISDLQRLFDGRFGASALPYARVRELVTLYATHYNHAIPFDEDVLDDIWSRCQDLRCGTTRRQVERMLEEGSLDLAPIAEKSVVTRVRRSTRDAGATTPDGTSTRDASPTTPDGRSPWGASRTTPDSSPEPEFE